MEIHELNTKALTDPAYVAFDDGTDTYKTEFNDVVESAANAAVAAADLTQNAVAFTSDDASSPTAWTSVPLLTSGSTLATLFNRISTMVKNVRWLYSKLGTTDISAIGDGTVTGALSTLNGNFIKQTSTATVFSNRATLSENIILKYGNVVFVNIRATANQALAQNTTFTNLPVPTTKQFLSINRSGAIAEIRTTASDGIVINGIASGQEFVISGAYLL